MAQMGLLLVCVLWLVLVSAADQRRGEVAVARLRGRGSRGARRLLLDETLPPVIVGAPLGALLAVGLSTVARRTVLTSDPPFEVPVSAVVALVAGLVLMVLLAVLSVRRVSRDPVADLIRSVPARRVGIRLGVLEAMLVAGAAAAFIALVTGSVQGPVGQLAPTLLALAVGVVAARVLSYLLGAGGRRLLQADGPPPAPRCSSSRRGTTRWLVPVVTVALSIIVVSADALAVGARNWAGRAAEVGAASVLTLNSVDLAAVTEAVRAVDPGGEHLTPVAVVAPAGRAGRRPSLSTRTPSAVSPVAGRPGRHPRLGPADRPDGAAAAPHRHPGRVPPRGVRDQRRDPGDPATPTSSRSASGSSVPTARSTLSPWERFRPTASPWTRKLPSAAPTGAASRASASSRPELGGGHRRTVTVSGAHRRRPTGRARRQRVLAGHGRRRHRRVGDVRRCRSHPPLLQQRLGQGVPPPRPSPTSSRP